MIKTLVVSGWRGNVSGDDAERIELILARFAGVATVTGDAGGVDAIAAAFTGPGLHTGFTAEWKAHGREAGPMRNVQMLKHASARGPALLIAFPHWQKSVGTWHTIKHATKLGMPTRIYPIGKAQ